MKTLPKIKAVTAEEDLAFMRKNKEKFVKKMGIKKFQELEKKLVDYIASKKSTDPKA